MQFVGKICYMHPERKVSEKATIQDIGLDESFEYEGRAMTNFVGMQVANKNIEKVKGFSVGDKVAIQASVGSFQVNKDKNGLDTIYNNVNIWAIESYADYEKRKNPSANQPSQTGEKLNF